MQSHRPHDPASTTWEADILKLRGLEMLLVLFYIEDLRRFILSSIRTTDRVWKRVDRLSAEPKRMGGEFEVAREILVAEGAISQPESDELRSLVDYRNIVGQALPELTADIGAYSALMRFSPGDSQLQGNSVAPRMKAMRKKVAQGMKRRFVLPNSLDTLLLDQAERTFQTEIAHLKRLVKKGLTLSNPVMADTSRVTGRNAK